MSAKTYESICRLIDGEGDNVRDYCFDEAWFAGLSRKPKAIREEQDERQKSIQIACKAIEENAGSGYSSSEKGLQSEMYQALLDKRRVLTKFRMKLTSEDRMTNFLYVMNFTIAILENSPRLDKPGSWYSVDYSQKRYDASLLYKRGYRVFKRAMDKAKHTDAESLGKELGCFAYLSSCLGNYACIPIRMRRIERKDRSCNSAKATGGMYVPIERDGKREWLSANDQFALFAEWINENTTASEKDLVEEWKKAMLLTGRVWVLYEKAAKAYKKIFQTTDQSKRIEALVKYLKLVNKAIEVRSDRIAKALRSYCS